MSQNDNATSEDFNVQDKVVSGPPEVIDYEPDPRGLGWQCFTSMNKYKDRTAQTFVDTGESETYEVVLLKTVRTSLRLRKRGVQPGDVIILCSGNHLDSCIPFLAGLFLGCKLASLDPRISLPDTIHLLMEVKSEAKIAFASVDCEQLMEEAFKEAGVDVELVIFGDTNRYTPYEEFLRDEDGYINEDSYIDQNGSVNNSSIDNSSIDNSSIGKSSIDKSSIGKNSIGKSSIGKSSINNSSIDNSSIDNSSIGKSSIDKSSIGKNSIGKSSIGKSSIGKSSIGKSSIEETNFTPYEEGSCHDTAIIFFSSGTTGLPKGICTSSYAAVLQANNMQACGYSAKVGLSYASLYWVSSGLQVTTTILMGGSRLLCSKFDPAQIWYLIEKYKVTTVFLAPIMAMYMLKVGRPEGIDTTSLLDLMVGGGSLQAKYILQLRDFLPGSTVSLIYGQTELAGIVTSFKPAFRKDLMLMLERPGSCGRACPGVQFRIVDPETEEVLGPNQQGELRVKTKFHMVGYHNRESTSAWDDQGWIKTGDVAYYDEEQCFYIVDRLKEMFKYQSFHIAPAAIEAVLETHPGVSMAIVIGIPHEEDGDHPMAVVILNANAGEDVTPEEVKEYVDGRVADMQRLRGGVKFVKELPYTATGKVRRNYLRQLVVDGAI